MHALFEAQSEMEIIGNVSNGTHLSFVRNQIDLKSTDFFYISYVVLEIHFTPNPKNGPAGKFIYSKPSFEQRKNR